jgi:hypothetical protein
MDERRASLSSVDSHSRDGSFDAIYELMISLKNDSTTLRERLKTFSKRIEEIPLQERLLEPRPNAQKWFELHGLKTPCELEEFLKVLFTEMGSQKRIEYRLRIMVLNQDEAKMFGLQGSNAYKWVDVISRLPNVFY